MNPTSNYDFRMYYYTKEDIITFNLLKTEISRISTKSYKKYDKKQKRGF